MKDFESIWIEFHVNNNLHALEPLTDEEYLDYNIWEDQNSETMYKKHLPDTLVFSGNNPNIIFHGGCIGCLSQRINGIDKCKGCLYFRFNQTLPDLSIQGEQSAKFKI